MHVNKRTRSGRVAARAGVVLALTATALVVTALPSAAATATPATNRVPSGGGYTLDIGVPTGLGGLTPATVQVQFQARIPGTPSSLTCSALAAAGGAITAITANASNVIQAGVINIPPTTGVTTVGATTVTVNVPPGFALPPGVPSADFNVCVYDTGTPALVGETITATPASILTLVAPVTTTPATGPTVGGNSLSVDSQAPIFVSGSTYVQFQKVTAGSLCASTLASVTNSASIIAPTAAAARVLTDYKLTVGLPALTLVADTDAFHTCVYSGTTIGGSGSPLIGASAFTGGRYTVAPGATVTGISPMAGPPQGNQNVLITGTGFPTDGVSMLDVRIGGVQLTNVTVSADGATLRGKTAPHSVGGPYAVTVTTAGGTFIGQKATYTYSNGLTVTPKVAPNGKATATDLDVYGNGFSGMDFSSSNGLDPNAAKAHVYLVKGVYNPTAGSPTTVKTNGQTAECTDVLVLSDSELICSVWTLGNFYTPTNRTTTGCTAATVVATLTIAGACSITAADVGSYVSGTNIKPGTTILSVVGAAVTLSQTVNAVVPGTDTLTVGVGKPLTGGTYTASELSGGTGHTFTVADVGKVVTGTNIPAGTYITAFNTTTSKVSLSKAPTGTVANVQLFNTSLVPSGVYTVTVVSNGAIGGQTAVGYSQSIITSGSTFTVADYN